MADDGGSTRQVTDLTAEIVEAYVANHTVRPEELSSLISAVHAALSRAPHLATAPEAPEPAVPIKKSVTSSYLVCLEDGLKFKSLRRHLRNAHSMEPNEYRAKWNLPADYPVVAADYSEARSTLAKTLGLGRKSTDKSREAIASDETSTEATASDESVTVEQTVRPAKKRSSTKRSSKKPSKRRHSRTSVK